MTRDFRGFAKYITKILKSAKRGDAVVFDIDDTVLTLTMVGSVPKKQIKAIYDRAVSKGIPVFFVTARIDTPSNERFTRQELARLGFRDYEGLYMRPRGYQSVVDISRAKAQARRDIAKSYNILLNVGDQWTDVYEFRNHQEWKQLEKSGRGYHFLLPIPGGWQIKLR